MSRVRKGLFLRCDENLDDFCKARTEKQMYFSLNPPQPLSRFKKFEYEVKAFKKSLYESRKKRRKNNMDCIFIGEENLDFMDSIVF